MQRLTVFFLLLILILGSIISAAAQPTITLAFYQNDNLYIVQREVSDQPSPALAAKLLLEGPTAIESALGITSAIPSGTSLNSSYVDDDGKVHLDLSSNYLDMGNDDLQIEKMGRQWFATFYQFTDVAGIIITINGQPLTDFLKPAEITEHAPDAFAIRPMATGISGKKITVSPGHGRYWNGSAWYYQRPQSCGYEEEDLRNLKMSIYLKAYLENAGATVKMPRDTNLTDVSTYDGNRLWYQMASPYWLKYNGYPLSVYASSTWESALGSGSGNEGNDDIRARPLMSDYDNTDIYVSIHTNALTGYCTGSGCPTGTVTYYDSSTEHATWGTISQTLANKINPGVVNAINAAYPSLSWTNRGVLNSGGNYGEIRIPDRAATLTEIGFHDTCDRDALYMNDNFFRSVAMWGMYKGICDYFGATATAMYNASYVSDDIPTTATEGDVKTVHVVLKNLGVLWSSSKSFYLGAVGNSDPFASSTRQSITGEVAPNDTYTFTFQMTFNTAGTYTTDWRMVRDGYTWFGPIVSKTVTVATFVDTQAPSVPTGLKTTQSTTNSITLSWNASTDNVGVTGYKIYRNSTQIGTSSTTSYTDTGLDLNQSYTYQVCAYDAIPNTSSLSTAILAMTAARVFNEGFDGSLSNWTPDESISSQNMLYNTNVNHGGIPGIGTAYCSPSTIQFLYHCLDSNTQSLTTGGYKTGLLTGWVYDCYGSVAGMRGGLRLYAYDADGNTKAIYMVGVTDNDSSLATHYVGGVWNGSWIYYDLGTRISLWHKMMIEVLPYTGSNDVKFYLDGTLKATASQPSDDAVLRRVYIGSDVYPGQGHYYDDINFDSAPPAAPSDVTGTGLSETSIRWSFTDNSDNEIGFRVYDGAAKAVEKETADITYIDETGLQPNTSYSRTIKAYAGVFESDGAAGTGCTLSVPPSASTVTCDKAAGIWQSVNPFTFSTVGGFGPGTVSGYRNVWDQQPSHVWTGAESVWSANSISNSAVASVNGWYFHIQGLNQAMASNGTMDMGPFYFDNTSPSKPAVSGNYYNNEALKASWSSLDNESGIEQYQYAIGTSSGSTDVLGWTAPSPANAVQATISGLSLTTGQTYYISVKALNYAQLWSDTGISNGILIQVPEVNINEAKALPDGSDIKIKSRVVSAVYAGAFYLEEPNRSSGIKVISNTTVQLGSIVNVTGRINSVNGERYVEANDVSVN